MLAAVGPILAHVGPMLALCWPMLAYVGPMWTHLGAYVAAMLERLAAEPIAWKLSRV